jgi:chorismate mutase
MVAKQAALGDCGVVALEWRTREVRAEVAMLGSDSTDSQTPRLDAFDEEFARERVAILRGQRRWKLRFAILIIGAALGAVALARPWVSADRGLLSEVQALLPISRNAASDTSAEEIDRLVREIASLKQEIAELTEARQQAADRIASLEAAEQEPRNRPATVYWYSDLAALTYQSPFPPRSTGGQTEGRQR